MPLLGFSIFREKIQDGTKKQTIRKMRKYPIKKGDKLYLWWNQSNTQREKLGEAICTEAMTIQIHSEYWVGKQRPLLYRWIGKDGNLWERVPIAEIMEIAKRDGFNGEDDFLAFFTQRPLPDVFQLIRWEQMVSSKETTEGKT